MIENPTNAQFCHRHERQQRRFWIRTRCLPQTASPQIRMAFYEAPVRMRCCTRRSGTSSSAPGASQVFWLRCYRWPLVPPGARPRCGSGSALRGTPWRTAHRLIDAAGAANIEGPTIPRICAGCGEPVDEAGTGRTCRHCRRPLCCSACRDWHEANCPLASGKTAEWPRASDNTLEHCGVITPMVYFASGFPVAARYSTLANTRPASQRHEATATPAKTGLATKAA